MKATAAQTEHQMDTEFKATYWNCPVGTARKYLRQVRDCGLVLQVGGGLCVAKRRVGPARSGLTTQAPQEVRFVIAHKSASSPR